MEEATNRGIPFAVGGGLAAMTYSDLWRDTKDIDLYILPADREAMIGLVLDLGLRDYYERAPYDRNWIFRSYREETIVDVMWAMANQRAQVDESWFRGPFGSVDSLLFRLLAPEEEIWSKLYVLQHDRCDWPEIFALLRAQGTQLDWPHLIERLGPDRRLFASVLDAFYWLAPEEALRFPDWLCAEMGIQHPRLEEQRSTADRARLLDSRPWFSQTGEAKTAC